LSRYAGGLVSEIARISWVATDPLLKKIADQPFSVGSS